MRLAFTLSKVESCRATKKTSTFCETLTILTTLFSICTTLGLRVFLHETHECGWCEVYRSKQIPVLFKYRSTKEYTSACSYSGINNFHAHEVNIHDKDSFLLVLLGGTVYSVCMCFNKSQDISMSYA